MRLLAETDARWDCSARLPVLRPGWLSCGFCGGESVVIRFWRFHRRPDGATWPYRCDVSVKCASCAAVWPHGLAVSAGLWARRARVSGPWWWRPLAVLAGLGLVPGGQALVEPTIWRREGKEFLMIAEESVDAMGWNR